MRRRLLARAAVRLASGALFALAFGSRPLHADTNEFYLRGVAAEFAGYDIIRATENPTGTSAITRSVTCTSGATDDLIYSFISPPVGVTSLASGTWTMNIHATRERNNSGGVTIKVYTYTRATDGTETLLFSSSFGTALPKNTITNATWTFVQTTPRATAATDRIVVKLYAAQPTGGTKVAGDGASILYDAANRNSKVVSPFDATGPNPASNFTGVTAGIGQVRFTWSSPGDDGVLKNLPAGSQYRIQYATYAADWDSASAQVLISTSNVAPNNAQNPTVSGLEGGTSYYFVLWTRDEVPNTSVVSNSTIAVPGRPSTPGALTPALPTVWVSSASGRWTNGGNPAGTFYNFQASTAADFTGTVLTSTTLNTAATIFALSPGVNYNFRVDAVISISSSLFLSMGSSVTLPAPPAAGPYSELGFSSVTVSWTDGANPPMTQYTVQGSTASNFTGTLLSDVTSALSSNFQALSGRTTYFFRVSASTNARSSAMASLGSTRTLVAPPAYLAPTFTSVFISSAPAQWTAGDNGSGSVLYNLQASTASDFTGTIRTSATATASAVVSALSTSTVHYFRVNAVVAGSSSAYVVLDSTVTRPTAPTVISPTFLSDPDASVVVSWGANGNGPAASYLLRYSTAADFTGTLISSITASASIPVSGLAASTTYYFQVRAFTESGNSSFTALGSTKTAAAAVVRPGTASPTFLMIGASSVTAQWSSGGNGSEVGYVLQASTAANITGTIVSSATADFSATVSPLLGNNTYFFNVGATFGGQSSFTALGSTVTRPMIPAADAEPVVMVGITSATVRWDSSVNSTWTLYGVEASTAADLTGTLSLASGQGSQATVTGLSLNTTYYFQVRASGSAGTSLYRSIGSTTTLPAAPAAGSPPFAAVHVTSAAPQWTFNGNGGGTLYTVRASTAPDFTGGILEAQTAGTSADVAGLDGNTTYYFAVSASSYSNVGPAAFLGSTITAAGEPAAGSPAFTNVLVTSAAVQWTDPINGPGTRYNVQCSTAADYTGTVRSSNTAEQAAWIVGLSTNSVYHCRVRSDGASVHSAYAALGSTRTLVPPIALASPVFTAIGVSSVAAQWQSGGNPAGTVYTLEASTGADMTGTIVSSETLNLSAAIDDLFSATTYFLRVKAAAGGFDSRYTFIGSTRTLPPEASAGNVFYFRHSNTDIGSYDALTATAAPTAGADSVRAVNTTAATDDLIYSYATPAVGTGTLTGGTWTFNIYGQQSANPTNATFRVIVSIRSGITESAFLNTLYPGEISTNKALYTWTASAGAVTVLPTDRIVAKVYATSAPGLTKRSGDTVTFRLDSTVGNSRFATPFDIAAPGSVADLSAATGAVGQIDLDWSNPGNDGPFGTLLTGSRYRIQHSTYVVAWSSSAAQVLIAGSGSPGSPQSHTIDGLTGGTTYYFAIWARDESGNIGEVSNTASAMAGRPATPGLQAPSITAVYITSAALQWTSGGNPGGTIYNLSASTAPDFTGVVQTSSTFGTSAVVSGLAPGTTYSFRAAAVIGISSSTYQALGSTLTLAPGANLTAVSVAPAYLNQGKKAALMRLTLAPGGEAVHGQAWLSARVKLMDQDGTALSNAQAGAILSSMSLVADALGNDTTGLYHANIDTAVIANVNGFALDGSGRQALIVSDPSAADAIVPAGASRHYFVIAEWTSNAAAQTPNTLRAEIVTGADAVFRDTVTLMTPTIAGSAVVTGSSTTATVPPSAPAGFPASLGSGGASSSNEGGFTLSDSGSVSYGGTLDNRFVSVGANGSLQWTFPTAAPVRGSPTGSFEGASDYVYFSDTNGNVYKLRDNGASATQMWMTNLPSVSNIVTSPLVVGATVFMAASDGKVYALKSSDGSDLAGGGTWGYNTPEAGAFTATPFIDDFTTGINSIFLGAQGGTMYRLSLFDGTVNASKTDVTSNIYATANLDSGLYNPTSNSNVLYWGADDGVLRARTSANLTTIPSGWSDFTVSPVAPIRTQPYINRDETPKGIYFGCNNGKVYKLNGQTGAVVWQYQTGGPVLTTPVVLLDAWTGAGADYVYFGSDDGSVYALNAANGAPRSGWPVALGGAVRAGTVYDSGTQTITTASMDGKVMKINVGP